MRRTRSVVTAGLLVALIVVLIWGSYNWGWEWTGFASSFSPATKGRDYLPGKTLWDWLQLLIVPAVLALWAAWFSRRQTLRDQLDKERRDHQAQLDKERRDHEAQVQLAQQNRETEFQLAAESQQDQVLATYLDHMSALLLNGDMKLRDSKHQDEVRTIARAWTRSSLTRLNGERKRHVVTFLYESLLLTTDEPIVALAGADLSKADLHEAQLSGANLRGANLSEADLSGADLREANLSEANLWKANLREVNSPRRGEPARTNLRLAMLRQADLSGANLIQVSLGGAVLSDAILTDSYLTGADLHDASLRRADLNRATLTWANLRRADLSRAVVSTAQLKSASLDGAIMPNGRAFQGWEGESYELSEVKQERHAAETDRFEAERAEASASSE
jgi:uncharacterized protein YjbI with pentapeptide repeats